MSFRASGNYIQFQLTTNKKKIICKVILSFFPIVFHHRIHNLLPFLLQVLPFILSLLLFTFFIKCRKQQFSFFSFLDLSYSRVGINIGPFDGQDFISVQCLISHGLLCKLSHAPVGILDKGIALMRQNIDVF
jgi:hypothetical protein